MERLIQGFGLIEGPTLELDGSLVFSDVVRGGVHRLRPDGTVEIVVEHRRGIGGIALHADGGHVISGRNVSWKRDGETTVLLDRDHEGMSFNDLTTDPDGRIYVGSLLFDPLDAASPRSPGDVYLIDLDGSSRIVHGDVRLTNGLAVSPDGSALYHSDTEAHAVWRYDRAADGSLTDRRALHEWDARAQPDGLAVAADGSVWVAMAGTGEVVGVGSDGEVLATIQVEVPMVTSVCFGGDDLGELYIVTGDRGAPPDVGGAVYRMPAPVPGLPVPPAQVTPA
jgi:D-xylonolactonase